jgi:hypothetical protein
MTSLLRKLGAGCCGFWILAVLAIALYLLVRTHLPPDE